MEIMTEQEQGKHVMWDEAGLQVLQCLPVAVVVCDGDGNILLANELAQSFIGNSLRKLQGKNFRDYFAPTSEIDRIFQHAISAMTVVSDSICSRQGHVPFSLHGQTQDNGWVLVLIPEAKRAEVEQQARRQELAEAVARIALERAHEVKNPLASLRGAAQSLVEKSSGELKEIATHVMREVDRIRVRIDTFLQVAPRANIQMLEVNIHHLIERVCVPPKHIQLHRAYDPGLPMLWLHESRFEQAIENLWVNAIEAGSSTIEWQTRAAPLVKLPDHHGMVVELKITSNGKPIPENLQHHVFEPYITAKARGSGLGLSIVQQVVQEHGGRVQLESSFGRTSFIIHIPLYLKAPEFGRRAA